MRIITRQDCILYLAIYKDPVIQAGLKLVLKRMDELGVDFLENELAPSVKVSA